jgi:hypothetical protein
MKIEGLFTDDEIEAAMARMAKIEILANGKISLIFPSQVAKDDWLNEQRRIHPERWAMSVHVTNRDVK